MNNLHLVTDAEIDAQFRYAVPLLADGTVYIVTVYRLRAGSDESWVGEIKLPIYGERRALGWTEPEAQAIARQLARLFIKKINT